MASHTKFNSQHARKTPAKSNIPIKSAAEVFSANQKERIAGASHGGQKYAHHSPNHVSSPSCAVSARGVGVSNVSPARNSAGFFTTGGKGPEYRVRLEALYGSQIFDEVPMISDSEEGSEVGKSGYRISEQEDEDNKERENENNREQKEGDHGEQEGGDDEGGAASDDEELMLFSQVGSHNGLSFCKTRKAKTTGVTHLKGLYLNQMNEGSAVDSLASSRGMISKPASLPRSVASKIPHKSVFLADYPALNAGGFVTTSRKVVAQDKSKATFASTVTPTAPKKKQRRVNKVLPKGKVLLPVTILKKYNRGEMNQLLIEFEDDSQSGHFKSMKAKELADAGEGTTTMEFEDEGTTLVDSEPVAAGTSRKRARVSSEDEGDYVNTTFKKAKTGRAVDLREDDVIKPYGANVITTQETDGDAVTPLCVVKIIKTLRAIKRAASQDIEIQKADRYKSDGNIDQDQDILMTILFDAQGNPRMPLNTQVGVHKILRLKDKMLPVYQQTGLSEEKEWSLSRDLDTFQAMLRKLSSALASKIFDEDVDSEQVARDLVNHIFAQDVEDGRI